LARRTAKEMGELAAPIFREEGWTYWDGDPDAGRLAATIEDLADSGEERIETGRFIVERDNEYGDEVIRVFLELGELVRPY